ncbi:MAG: 30S ribosomal protein S4, partial [Roseimicrobium sp.]
KMGLANSRFSARQMVGHGHIAVNGTRVNIGSYITKPGDVVTVKNTPRSQQLANRFLDLTQGVTAPDWMTVDRDKLTGTINRAPEREEIHVFVNEQLVVELYSR